MSVCQMAQFLMVAGCSSTGIAFAILIHCLFVRKTVQMLRWMTALGLTGAMCLYQYTRYLPLVR